ncbi:MAG: PKD domain-containing protein, partial [Thermoplasmata archaeon]
MESERAQDKTPVRWGRNRALSTPTAAVIMIIVIVVVGGLGYLGFNAVNGQSKTINSCTPVNSPGCSPFSQTHDMTLFTPYSSVQAGNAVPFSAGLPSGVTASSYTFNFGDGVTQTTSTPQVSHVYTNPGTYI